VRIEISLSSTDRELHETKLFRLKFRPSDIIVPNWTLNPQDLEGILGLWLWSLKHDPRLETGDGHGNKISVADRIGKARIIGIDHLSHFARWGHMLDRWSDKRPCDDGRTWDLYIPKDDVTDPRTIWLPNITPCAPAEFEIIDKTLPEKLIRFGGWGNVADYTSLKDHVSVRGFGTEEPLDLFCTVELFCTVLRAILDENSIQLGEAVPIEKEGQLGWENEKVSKVLGAFVNGLLGNHYNAIFCLIPILTGHMWIPKGRFLLSALLKSSIQHQQKQEWEKAEIMLKDACLNYCSSPVEGIQGLQEALSHNANPTDIRDFSFYLGFEEHLSAVVALGELYISALWSAPSNRRLEKFGTSGIQWMQQKLAKEGEYRPFLYMQTDRDPSYRATIESVILTYTLNACALLGSHQDVRLKGEEGWMVWKPKSAYQDSSLEPPNVSYPLSYKEERKRLSQNRFQISRLGEITLSSSGHWPERGELILSAVEHSSPEVLVWFLERTDKSHIKDDEIQVAIQRCLEKDDAVIAKVFLDCGVNLEQTFGLYHSTDVLWLLLGLDMDTNWGNILLSCMESNWLEAVVILLRKKKTYPDRENSDKRTALLIASERGNLAMVDRLLQEEEFHPNVKDQEGCTPLIRAAKNGYANVVDRLIDVPDIEIQRSACRPLLIIAVEHIVDYPNILTKLLQENMVRDIVLAYVHSDGRNLLSYAAENGLEAIVKNLLDMNKKMKAFNPDWQDDYGRTPLSYAAAAGNEKIVGMMLETNEVNPNSTDIKGRTPAFWAESNGHTGVVLKIVGRGHL
jgi:ankyrin repeat protein